MQKLNKTYSIGVISVVITHFILHICMIAGNTMYITFVIDIGQLQVVIVHNAPIGRSDDRHKHFSYERVMMTLYIWLKHMSLWKEWL